MRLAALCLLAVTIAAAQKDKPAAAKTKQTTLTGCIDQRGETYVITEDTAMKAQAVLKGRAFSDDNFARFIWTKAAATGELKDEEGKRLLHVTKIETVAGTCR